MGEVGAPISERPFDLAFNKERMERALDKIGLWPWTRRSLDDTRLRTHCDTGSAGPMAKEVARQSALHAASIQSLKERGMHTIALEKVIKKRKKDPQDPKTTYSVGASQENQDAINILHAKRTTSGNMFTTLGGARALTSNAVLKGFVAREQHKAIEERGSVEKADSKKNEA